MIRAARQVLIIGGGFSGMSAAIQLRKHGFAVDLVEIDPSWRSYGAGITLCGATLRAFATLNVLDRFLAEGAGSDGADICSPDGQLIARLPTPRIVRPDVPGSGGIMRPVLAKILADATRASGVTVRLGQTFTSIRDHADGVEVALTDGTTRRYDLVIGADGLYSKVREHLFENAPKPKYVGQAVWRAVLPRPAEIACAVMWMGPKNKPGVNPVSTAQMYLFLTEHRAANERVDPAHFTRSLKALLEPFPAPTLQAIRAQLDEHSQIVFRPLEQLLLPQPWHRGRVVLIGDAVHATTPHLGAGACIGIEDGIVLADELARADDVQSAVRAFEARRWERCRMVVENSARLCEIEIAGGDKTEHARLMRDSFAALSQPI